MRDFVIIGGGIAGLSAAARLAGLGSVTLLEREDALAYHASGRSAALYEPQYGKPATVALSLASHADLAAADVLSPRGVMLVGGPQDAAAFAADLAALHLQPITLTEARALLPILDRSVVDRVGYHPEASDIDTDRLVQHFARQARAQGAQVLTKSEVTGITRTDHGWIIRTKTGDHAGRKLVNAAGAWVDQVAVLAGVPPLGFRALRRSMARIPAPAGHDPRAWPMVFGPGESWYAKPDAGALIVSPADEDPVAPQDAFADDLVLAEGLARFEAHVTARVTRLLASWAGLRTFAPDRTLVLGPDPLARDFIWCAGQGGYGMQSAPAASQLLADLVSGAAPALAPEIVAALRPDRLR